MSDSILDEGLIETLLGLVEPVEQSCLKNNSQTEQARRVYKMADLLRKARDADAVRSNPSSLPGGTAASGMHATLLAHGVLSKLKTFIEGSGPALEGLSPGGLPGFDAKDFESLVTAHTRYREGVRQHLKQ